VPVGLLLAERVGNRIAANAAIFEREGVGLGQLRPARALAGALITPCFVRQPDLAPRLCPLIAIEARERVNDRFGLLAADTFERIEASGAPYDLGLDLIQRALLGASLGGLGRNTGGDRCLCHRGGSSLNGRLSRKAFSLANAPIRAPCSRHGGVRQGDAV
jgi:hypothetical protein